MLALLAGTGLVSACGEAGDAPASAAAPPAALSPVAASAVSGAAPLRPGLYRTVQTGDVEIEETRCVDAATIAAGRFLPAGSLEPSWMVDRDRLAGGRIEVAARHPGGGRLQLAGRYDADSFVVDGTLELPVEGGMHRVRTQQTGRYLSPDCDSDPDRQDGD